MSSKNQMYTRLNFLSLILFFTCYLAIVNRAEGDPISDPRPWVATVEMDMLILPGTAQYLDYAIDVAVRENAQALVISLDTPGGMLESSKEMIASILASPVPIVVYVSPQGSTATSAGVFITEAAHVAAMSSGTSIGSAHPVASDGKDIDGDMRTKVENMTVAMMKSISEERGRNLAWVEKAIRESISATASEALTLGVVDIVAENHDDLLRQMKGRIVKLPLGARTLEDLSGLPRRSIEMPIKHALLNTMANPSVAALLWLGATTGLSVELYNPGAILPGVVGVICLLLALLVSQLIPLNLGAVLLLVLGILLIGMELYITSGVLAVGGIISIVLGLVYLVDGDLAPGMQVALEMVLPIAALLAGAVFWVLYQIVRTRKLKFATGKEGLLGLKGKVLETVSAHGKISVNGEVWNACADRGVIEKDFEVEVIEVLDGMVLKVKRVEAQST